MKNIVIIPTYNERQNIQQIINRVHCLGNVDMLVIDDNSPDGTGEHLEELRKVSPALRLEIIHRHKKSGLGTAYIEGFRWAMKKNYDIIFTMDADLSHNPDYLPSFLEKLKTVDFIVGSRYISGGGIIGWSISRKLISAAGNFYARTVTGLPIKDCTSGFIGFRSKVIESIDLNMLHSEGYAFLIEFKFTALKNGCTFAEIPIIFTDRTSGKSKISKKIIFEAFFLTWKLRYERIFKGRQ